MVNKTGINSFSLGMYHLAGTCVCLSAVPLVPLKMFSHDFFFLLLSHKYIHLFIYLFSPFFYYSNEFITSVVV